MTASTFKHKESIMFVATTLAIVFLLTLSAMSIHLLIRSVNEARVKQKEKVLGVSKQNDEKSFWVSFLADNPYYYPGWKRLNEISHETNNIKLQERTKYELEQLKPIGE